MPTNLSAIGDKYAAKISQAFQDWRDAYEAGEGAGAIHIEPFDPEPYIRACYAEAGAAGAEAILELIDVPGIGFAFNMRSPEAEAWIKDYAAQEIKYIDAATKQTIRQITLRAFQEGLTAQQQSKLIRQHIGLLPQHAVAVRNYRDSLEGIDPALKDKLVDKYRRKLLKWRSDTIALSESHSASNAGNRESVRQAVKRGILDPNEYEMELFNHADKRICPICNSLRGSRCPLPGGIYGGRSGPPFHPRCRDTELTVKIGSKPRSSPVSEISEIKQSPKVSKQTVQPKDKLATLSIPSEQFPGIKPSTKRETLPGNARIIANPGDEKIAKITLDNFNAMPAKLRAGCNEIAILPKANADDARLTAMYGKSVRTEAAYDPVHKRILGFPGADGKTRAIDQGYMAHELAHPLDDSMGKISDKLAWKKYAAKDGNFVSQYASDYHQLHNSFKEDFADSIKLYVTDHDNFAKNFPNRADYIKRKIL